MSDEITQIGYSFQEVKTKGRCGNVWSVASTVRQILPAFMTIPEVAHLLNVSEKTVRRLVERKILPRCRHLGKVLIPRDAVEKWIVESTRN